MRLLILLSELLMYVSLSITVMVFLILLKPIDDLLDSLRPVVQELSGRQIFQAFYFAFIINVVIFFIVELLEKRAIWKLSAEELANSLLFLGKANGSDFKCNQRAMIIINLRASWFYSPMMVYGFVLPVLIFYKLPLAVKRKRKSAL